MIRFYRTPNVLKSYFSAYTWSLKTPDSIYLTFDVAIKLLAPGFMAGTEALDQLESYKAKGTFFVVGENVNKFSSVVALAHEQGHTVSNHTYNHLKGWSTPDEEYLENIQQCDEVIASVIGTQSTFFRPPYGRIKSSQALLLENRDIIMWSHLSWDFDRRLNTDRSIEALSMADPGSVIVFHDSVKAEKNLKVILPTLLDIYANRGLQMIAL